MQIGVIGAGAIGGTLAALLHRNGHELVIASRRDTANEMELILHGAFGEYRATVECMPQLPGEVDVVVCATKVGDLGEALRTNRGGCLGSPILCVQNGVRGPEIARDALGPRARLLHGLASFAARADAPGEVTVTGGSGLVIGASEGTRGSLAEAVAGLFPPELCCSVTDDIASAMWSKLLVNQLNALPAITDLPMQDLYAADDMARITAQAMVEVYELGCALGHSFPTIPLFTDAARASLEAARTSSAAVMPSLVTDMVSTFGEVPNLGSTLQSLRRGVASENVALGHDPVQLAQDAGLMLPVVARLATLVDARERERRAPLRLDEVRGEFAEWCAAS